ncbi:MAG: multidrug effflux MFS transporter [Beijerinckiaceae bacterium]|nr:multidrug effflux MFS transporter [Beijerinckiaceae bacterium]
MSRAPTSRQPGPAFALALASISLIGPLSIHIYLPVIPAVKASLELSDAVAQSTFALGLATMAFSTLFWGSMSDRFGRRPVLLSGLVVFLVGSLACAMAQGIVTLILGRLLQAFGAGVGGALARTIARDAYGPDKLVRAIAYLTMFYTLGPMISPIAGGLLIDLFSWRAVFGFSLFMGAIILAGAYFIIWETRPRAQTGVIPKGFIRNSIELFSHLRFTCFVLQTGFNTGAFFVAASSAAFLMKETLQRPAAEFGFWFALFPLGFFAGNFVSSRVGGRASNEKMVLIGAILALGAVSLQSSLLIAGFITPLAIFAPGFLITFAQGISLPYGQAGAIATLPRIAGTAAGIGVFMQNIVGAIFAQLYGFLANGTIWPIVFATGLSTVLGVLVSIPPALARRRALAAR